MFASTCLSWPESYGVVCGHVQTFSAWPGTLWGVWYR